MSYDLYLRRPDGALTARQFVAFFEGRDGYKAGETEVFYENADTGVYFTLDWLEGGAADPEGHPIAVNVNYFRPSFFGREIEPQLAALVAGLGLEVEDPQADGMDGRAYSGAGFLSGWNAGNAIAYRAILSQPENRAGVLHLPAARLHAAWAWNHGRRALQAELGDVWFVPKVMFVRVDGELGTAMVWGDAVASAVPEVDWLIVPRDALAPTQRGREGADRALVAWAEVAPVLERHRLARADGRLVLDYDEVPDDVASFVRALPTADATIAGVSPDRVLDRELVEAALAEPAVVLDDDDDERADEVE